MYLSQLVLNTRSHHVQRDLANCYDMHRTVMSGWGDLEDGPARASARVLYRLDEHQSGLILIVQSASSPDWSRLPSGYVRRPAESKAIDHVLATLRTGRLLKFRLCANPTRCISTDAGGSKRVDIRPEEKRVEWLCRRAAAAGFALASDEHGRLALRVGPVCQLRGSRGGRESGTVTIAATLFEGVLRVTDEGQFREALAAGIGRGKAFGCGLLSVAPNGSR